MNVGDTSGKPRLARTESPVGTAAGWRQRSWDWRAAANFVCGGAGAGLAVLTMIAAPAPARPGLLVAAAALVTIGLLCVWAEIGKPARALNVFLNPFTSWMTREALFAAVFIPCALGAALGVPLLGWVAAMAAFAFLFSQAYILRAAKGIPAWRDARTPPLILATGFAEGAGLLVAALAFGIDVPALAWGGLAALIAVRAVLWRAWRAGLRNALAPRAASVLDRAGRWLLIGGTWVPLLALAVATVAPGGAATVLRCLAGVLAAAAGAAFKTTLIGSASYNQGYTLARLPVRGTRR